MRGIEGLEHAGRVDASSRGQAGRSSTGLMLLLAVALVALGVLAWWVVGGSGPHASVDVPLDAPAPREDASAPIASDPSGTSAARERESSAASRPAAASAHEPAPPPRGALKLRVLDAATREPVAGLAFLVLADRGREFVLARGRTDAHGSAEVRGLEAQALCVRTERAPPHATAFARASVLADRVVELEILAGRGGALVGRVVDDRKLPVAGAALHLSLPVASSALGKPVAQSGPDGRFRIECVAGDAANTASSDGANAAVPVLAVLGTQSAHADAIPRADADVDLGDLVLARTARYSGRVVDPDERPVAGALVSLNEGRLYARKHRPEDAQDELLRRAPADADFQLLAGETLTDGGGRFELEADGSGVRVVVWSRAGALQPFPLPRAEPGARKDDLVLRLEPRTSVVLELVDAAGASAPVPAAQISSHGSWAPWGVAGVFGEGRVSILARAGGKPIAWDSSGVRGSDGSWHLELRTDAARIEELDLCASGYALVTEHPAQGFQAPIVLRQVLEALPALRVRLSSSERDAQLLPEPGEELELHVCMADPLRHANAALGFCCGNGCFWKGDWRGQTLPLCIPVRRKGAYFVHVRLRQQGEFRDAVSFGPFEPGAEEHELALDAAALAESVRVAGRRAAPIAAGEPVALLDARIEDARTGKPIARASLLLDEIVAPPHQPRVQRIDADEAGLIRRVRVLAGRWSVRGIVRGYARSVLAERDVGQGQTLDLGTLQLEPLPAHGGRVLDAAGAPVGDAWLVLLDAEAKELDASRMSSCTSDGWFLFYGDVPAKSVLHVERPARVGGEPVEAQRFVMDAWTDGKPREVRLAPSRRIVLLLNGTSPGEVPLPISACPAPDEPTGLCDHRDALPAVHVPLETAVPIEPLPGLQRCVLRLAPGRYQLYGQNLLHSLPVTELEVGAGTGDVELTLGVQ